MIFEGLATALITPFCRGRVDYDALRRIAMGALRFSEALVALGTTAEPCALCLAEKRKVVRLLRECTQKPLIVGVEGNTTADVARRAAMWQAEGADALLCITPYYNKCTQEGLVAHYAEVCKKVGVDIILYNVPARTGMNIEPQTLRQLLRLPRVAGIKEASGNAKQIVQYARFCAEEGKALYCGDDGLLPLFRVLGATGIVSAAANAVPDVMAQGIRAAFGDLARWSKRYSTLLERMFGVVNPIGVKAACSALGLCRNELRLPLTPVDDEALNALLQQAGYVPRTQ